MANHVKVYRFTPSLESKGISADLYNINKPCCSEPQYKYVSVLRFTSKNFDIYTITYPMYESHGFHTGSTPTSGLHTM